MRLTGPKTRGKDQDSGKRCSFNLQACLDIAMFTCGQSERGGGLTMKTLIVTGGVL